jgi:hypothetical protein
VSDELERMWKEAIMACYKVLSRHFLEKLTKATRNVRIAGFWVERVYRIQCRSS